MALVATSALPMSSHGPGPREQQDIRENAMNQTRRSLLITMAATSAASALSPWRALAQADYPTRPVRVIVPYAAGGGTDFFARLVFGAADRKSTRLNSSHANISYAVFCLK